MLKRERVKSSLTFIMRPRLYMQTIQFASYKRDTGNVTFETRHASGRRSHFILTENQFLAFDDFIALSQKSDRYGHYPLGKTMWLHYNGHNVRLYREMPDHGRIKFDFECFEQYKSHTHARLRSLIRSKRYGKASLARHQRSLSVTMQSSHQPSTSKQRCRIKRKAISRSTDNVKLPLNVKARSVLSERDRSNPRRRSDSTSSGSSMCTNLSSVVSVRLNSPDGRMETE